MSHSISISSFRNAALVTAIGLFVGRCTPCVGACGVVRLVDSQSGRPVEDAVIDFPGQGLGRSFVYLNSGGTYDIPICSRSLPMEITSPTHRTKMTTYVPMPPREACHPVVHETITILLDPS